MSRYLPILAGALVIVGLTFVQVMMTDRLSGTNFTAEQRAELLKLVPKNFGDWSGEDKPVDPSVRKTAGAIGAVSRDYRNARTGEKVELWLIVGHARDVAFHTPDQCYPGSGFEARAAENGKYPFVVAGQPETVFWTNTFYKEDTVSGRTLRRVFWTWFNPEAKENKGEVVWEAAENARWHFGNTRGLFKMYFTSEMPDPTETAEQSACLHFARDFLPEVNKALMEVYKKAPDGAGKPADQTPAETSATTPNAEQPAAVSTEVPSEGAKTEATPPVDGVAPATAPAAVLAPQVDQSKDRLEAVPPTTPTQQ